jgi:hypothetical protein
MAIDRIPDCPDGLSLRDDGANRYEGRGGSRLDDMQPISKSRQARTEACEAGYEAARESTRHDD